MSDSWLPEFIQRAFARLSSIIAAAIDKIRQNTSKEDLEKAIESGNIISAVDTIAMETGLSDLLENIPIELRQTLETAGQEEAGRLAAQFNLRFDIVNQSAIDFVREHSGELIKEFQDSSIQAIRSLIEKGIQDGIPPRKLAGLIADSGIGLTERQLNALERYRLGLEADGALTDAQIDRLVAAQAQRMLKYRTEMIARTEIISASTAGKQELWRQAVAKGLIDPSKALQVWITAEDERTCEECEALDGETARLEGEFPGGYDGPPAHPNCRCSIALLPLGEGGPEEE